MAEGTATQTRIPMPEAGSVRRVPLAPTAHFSKTEARGLTPGRAAAQRERSTVYRRRAYRRRDRSAPPRARPATRRPKTTKCASPAVLSSWVLRRPSVRGIHGYPAVLMESTWSWSPPSSWIDSRSPMRSSRTAFELAYARRMASRLCSETHRRLGAPSLRCGTATRQRTATGSERGFLQKPSGRRLRGDRRGFSSRTPGHRAARWRLFAVR